MDSKTAFRIGFLTRCAEEQLAPEQVHSRLDLLTKSAGWLDTLANLALVRAPLLGLGAATTVGGLAGYGLSQMDSEDFSADEIQAKELTAEYRQAIEQLKANRKKRQATTPVFAGQRL